MPNSDQCKDTTGHEEKSADGVPSLLRHKIASRFILCIHVSRPPGLRADATVIVARPGPAGARKESASMVHTIRVISGG